MLEILFNAFYILLVVPYWILFIKDLSVSIRLLFVILAEMLLLSIALILTNCIAIGAFDAMLFPFSIFAELIIVLNVLIIVSIWLFKKIRKIIHSITNSIIH